MLCDFNVEKEMKEITKCNGDATNNNICISKNSNSENEKKAENSRITVVIALSSKRQKIYIN